MAKRPKSPIPDGPQERSSRERRRGCAGTKDGPSPAKNRGVLDRLRPNNGKKGRGNDVAKPNHAVASHETHGFGIRTTTPVCWILALFRAARVVRAKDRPDHSSYRE